MGKAKDRRRSDTAAAKAAAAKVARVRKKAKKKAGKADAEGRIPAKKSKPAGMRWVNPYISVRDVTASLAWYERAFGFKTSFSLPGPDGNPIHAEMTHRKSVVMVGPLGADQVGGTGKAGGAPVTLYCYCEDVDAMAAAARAAGAKILEEPGDQFWGDRTCFIVDPDGHQWMFATHKFDMDPNAPPPMPAEGENARPAKP